MTAEGIFPKVPGDVLYSSEINGFYNLPVYIKRIYLILNEINKRLNSLEEV
jgi:hypothetical protein